MKVFLTGATGFIGSRIIPELLDAGHQVIGLTRSEAGVESLTAAGAQPHRGDLEDVESLRSGAAMSDAVIHCGFVHDFARFAEVCEIDRLAIEAMGDVLAGSDRPLIVSAGIGPWTPGRPVTEDVDHPKDSPMPRVSEQTALALIEKGVSSAVVRLPQVHDPVKQGLVMFLVASAREKGVSAYVGDGQNRWPACHVLDCARLYRLALDNHKTGARYHSVAEEGVPLKDIAEALGRGMNIPVVSKSPQEAAEHFGPQRAYFVSADIPASSVWTQSQLSWTPTGPTMIEDLDAMVH